MEPFILKRRFEYQSKIKELSNLVVDQDLKYLKDQDGLEIKGNLSLSGMVHLEEDKVPLNEEIEVDIYIALNKLDSLKNISLVIDKIDHHLLDKELEISITLKLLGDNEDFVSFNLSDNYDLNKAILDNLLTIDASNPLLRNELEDEDEKQLERIIKDEELEVFEDKTDNEDDLIKIVQDEVIPIPTPIIKEDDKKLEIKKPSKEKLLKENFVTTFLYYKVQENDEYYLIEEKFKLEKNYLKNYHHNKELIPYTLLEIPLK